MMPNLPTGHPLSEEWSIVAAVHYVFAAIFDRRATRVYRTGNS